MAFPSHLSRLVSDLNVPVQPTFSFLVCSDVALILNELSSPDSKTNFL